MARVRTRQAIVLLFLGCLPIQEVAGLQQFAKAQQSLPFTIPEQRHLQLREAEQIPSRAVPDVPAPYTIASDRKSLRPEELTLDEAIRLGLERAEVVRVLAGISATTSGRTLYDVAIANAGIDVQNAAFDPTFNLLSTLNKSDQPIAILDPADPGNSLITGTTADSVTTTANLSKRMFNGATAGLNLTPSGTYFSPGIFPLDPQYNSGVEMTYRQPFLRGAGREANLAPVVIARIETERSWFQFKDSIQELVRGIIDAYWTLVAARVEVWAREQQVEQASFAYERAVARVEEGLGRAADAAQAESAMANFRAALVTAYSNQILAETALRNLLGLAPSADSELVPVSAPIRERIELDWYRLLAVAETQRPDIIELKLILEADQQSLMLAGNQARPQFDGIANYRWDGLRGEMPNGNPLSSGPGQFAGFNVGVNFSVPLGLRQSRAELRRQELIIQRDQANLEQGIHQMTHQLTINYRNLDQFLAEVDAFSKARQAALVNYENQFGEFQAGRQNLLNGLQAITDWGNAVAQEARSVTRYNIELANLERETGTILPTHGVVFVEERYASLGPLGRGGNPACYPYKMNVIGSDLNKFPDTGRAAENAFDLKDLGGADSQSDDQEAEDENLKDRSDDSSEPPSNRSDENGADEEQPAARGGLLSDLSNGSLRRFRLFKK